MKVDKFDIPRSDGSLITFTIKTYLPPDTISVIKDEFVRTSKDSNYLYGMLVWYTKLAASAIIEPKEYSGREDKIDVLAGGIVFRLCNKLDKWYPFLDYVPEESREIMRKLKEEWDRSFEACYENN